MPVLLAEIDYRDVAAAEDKVLRVASEAWRGPDGLYEDRMLALPQVKRSMAAEGRAIGAASMDYGRLLLVNAAGDLDHLADADAFAIDGRPVRLLELPSSASTYEDAVVTFTGRAGQVLVGDTVEIRLMDDFAVALDKRANLKQFAGDNVPPAGVEGGEDLKDAWAPVLIGHAVGIAPVLVNAVSNTFCLADRGPIGIDQVAVKGAALTAGTARASVAALQAATVPAGKFDWFPGDGTTPAYIRMGTAPDGQVTADVHAGSGADLYPATLWRAVLMARAGIDAGDIATEDVTALDTALPAPCGGWWSGEVTVRDILDALAATLGGNYWQDSAGRWRLTRLADPAAGEPAMTLRSLSLDSPGKAEDGDIVSIAPQFTGRDEGDLPIGDVVLRFGRRHTVQDRDALAGVALADADRLGREWQEVSVSNAAVKALHPLAGRIERDTLFRDRADALAEAERLRDLHSVARRRYAVVAQLPAGIVGAVDLGVVAALVHRRWGLADGRNHVVLEIETGELAQSTKLTVWG